MSSKTPDFHAFTIVSTGGFLRDLKTTCQICAAADPSAPAPPIQNSPGLSTFVAIWDTGATGCVITEAVVDACGLKPIGMMKVKGAYGDVTDRNAYLVEIGLPNGVMVRGVTASQGEMAGADVLIGMNIITLGDFAVTNQGGNTTFTFRIPSLHTINYVKQAEQLKVSAASLMGRQHGKAKHHK